MLVKNSLYTVEITGVGSDGEGVGKVNGFTVFVPFALLGETVEVKIVKSLKKYAFGKLLHVVKPSKNRVEPQCEYFAQCGGCSFWHVNYEGELQYKLQKVKDCITRIGGINTPVNDIIGCDEYTRYRNKAQYAVTPSGIGFYAPRSHRTISIDDCIIQNENNKKIIDIIREFMLQYAIKPYDESTHTGIIRNIYTRVAKHTGEIMICIVTLSNKFPRSEILVSELLNSGLNITSIIQNINSEKTNVAMGNENKIIHGNGYITDKIGDLQFKISPHSFFQINPVQTKVLYDNVVNLAEFTGNETVFDLYCGIGTISLYVAKFCKKVIGVEVVPEAIQDAKQNAKENNITNAEFLLGNAEDVVKNLETADVVIIDPPRKGCNEKLLEAINNISPKKIIYVSCNPATLARDLKILEQYNYTSKTIQPVDMFPKTVHVECVVGLQRKDTL